MLKVTRLNKSHRVGIAQNERINSNIQDSYADFICKLSIKLFMHHEIDLQAVRSLTITHYRHT